MTVRTAPALELLADGECTPGCLLAMNSLIEDCTCRCGGRWHGTLLWADATEWSGPSEIDPPTGAGD